MKAFHAMIAAALLAVSFQPPAPAAEVEVIFSPQLPEAIPFASFTGPQRSGGWGWYRHDGSARDTGFSFQSEGDEQLGMLTFRLIRVREGFASPAPFRVEWYELPAPNESPAKGKLLAQHRGEMQLEAQPQEGYLSFVFPEPLSLKSGGAYAVLLVWEDAAPYTVLEFELGAPLPGGRVWYRSGNDDFKPIIGDPLPGLLYWFYPPDSTSNP